MAADDPTVITDWNAIAVSTLAGDTTKTPVEAILYMAFVHAAVYDAVVGIDGRYAPYRFHAHAPHRASAQAAAVAAAHKILVTYSPYAQAKLDSDYAASLALARPRRPSVPKPRPIPRCSTPAWPTSSSRPCCAIRCRSGTWISWTPPGCSPPPT